MKDHSRSPVYYLLTCYTRNITSPCTDDQNVLNFLQFCTCSGASIRRLAPLWEEFSNRFLWSGAPKRHVKRFLSVFTLLQAEVCEQDLPRFQGMPCVLSDGSRHHGDEKTKRGFCYIPPVKYPDGKCPVTMKMPELPEGLKLPKNKTPKSLQYEPEIHVSFATVWISCFLISYPLPISESAPEPNKLFFCQVSCT